MRVLDQLSQVQQCFSFKEKAVPTDVIYDLVQAALAAPHPADIFPTEFIVVRDKAKIKLLAEQCPKQSWLEFVPCLIIACSNQEKMKTLYGNRAELYAHQVTAAACYALLLQAKESKLGGCWVRLFNEKAVARILESKLVPEAILAVGYPKEKEKKARVLTSASDVVSFEKQDEKLSPF